MRADINRHIQVVGFLPQEDAAAAVRIDQVVAAPPFEREGVGWAGWEPVGLEIRCVGRPRQG